MDGISVYVSKVWIDRTWVPTFSLKYLNTESFSTVQGFGGLDELDFGDSNFPVKLKVGDLKTSA